MQLEYLKKELNPEQYEAVTTIDGPLLIIAGAGSGKTRVITYRIAHMLDSGIPQSSILALTFTNKASREMEERVKALTGKKLQNLTVSTFHSFGVKILRQDCDKLGWRENFSIYDEVDKGQLIKETGRELGFTQDALDVLKIGRWQWKSEYDAYKKLYEEYQSGLKLYNAVDFDDLIALPIKLFHEHPDVLEKYKSRYKYIMVDEFQDTSMQQYEFMHLLADKNVAVVGDDDQSIYSWRGANYENIVNFERDFQDVKEIRLEQNYRSTETILAAANGVISHNTNRKDKSLWSGNGSGKPIEIFMPENETDEAEFIAESIQGIAATERRKYDDFGVLIRANTLSRAIEEAFLNANIPYTMSGGTSFFQRKEIKDIISYLRLIANHDDDINLLRIINTPRRGIGRKTLEEINAIANAKHCSLWTAISELLKSDNTVLAEKTKADLQSFIDLIENQRTAILAGGGKNLGTKVHNLVEEVNYWDYLISENQKNDKAARFKMMNIEHLVQSIDSWENNPDTMENGLYAYLNRITLLSRDDMEDDSMKGKVNLMTIHASKGLEFPIVFIAGCEDGIIPHARCIEEDPANIEEERRLFYVAITRARDKLFLTSCQHRRKMQSTIECVPSPFLDEIPANLVEYHEVETQVSDEDALAMLAQMKERFAPKKLDW